MKFDHAQLLISLDMLILPAPPPPQPVGPRRQRQIFDHVLFASQLDKWRQIVHSLRNSTTVDGEQVSGQEFFDGHLVAVPWPGSYTLRP